MFCPLLPMYRSIRTKQWTTHLPIAKEITLRTLYETETAAVHKDGSRCCCYGITILINSSAG